MTDIKKLILGEKIFSVDEQRLFSELSGDVNPIHVDAAFARKTFVGDLVVHGVSGLLWALECAADHSVPITHKIQTRFHSPIKVNEAVSVVLIDVAKKLEIISKNDRELKYSVFFEDEKITEYSSEDVPCNIFPYLKLPLDNRIHSLAVGTKFSELQGGNVDLAKKLYPKLITVLGANTVYEISTLSSAVGMLVPGLHSFYTGLDIELCRKLQSKKPILEINMVDDRFNFVELNYQGVNVDAVAQAIERQVYVTPSCAEISDKTSRDETFVGKKILIVGGSRGIGAVLAKVLCFKGAECTITYNVGATEVSEIQNDVREFFGYNLSCIELNVLNEECFSSLHGSFDAICYFASPKITKGSKDKFDVHLFKKYYTFYCEAFSLLIEKLSRKDLNLVYYPSTVFIEQENDFEEYSSAKSLGEKICLNFVSNRINCVIDRLKPIKTDQTLGVANDQLIHPIDAAISISEKISSAWFGTR